MDIISINVAARKAIAKLRDDGIEALTLIGADGKQYELTINGMGGLDVTVKGGSTGGDTGGNTGGGSGTGAAEQLIVNIDKYGEYGSYDFGEREYFHLTSKVPTLQQLERSTLYIGFMSESQKNFVACDVTDCGDYWEADYREEYSESVDSYGTVIVVPNDTVERAKGVYLLNFDDIASIYEDEFSTGYITFPEVTA